MKTWILLAAASVPAMAEVKLPALISDNMVLQQGMPVRIWGTAAAGEAVTVTFLGQSVGTKADRGGKWQAFLAPMAAGGPYEMTINGAAVKNVLVGEVWVGSGQSNMVWPVARSTNSEKEIGAARYPSIRFFQVKTTVAAAPAEDVTGSWKECTPENAPTFSGVGYFFARDLHLHQRVPVGFIQSAVGGTPAQAWTSREALEGNKMLHWYLERWSKFQAEYPAARGRYEQQLAAWKKEAAKARAEGREAVRQPQQPAGAPGHPHTPSGLYNGMIAPLTPYAIRGITWYQGEANAGPTDNELYRVLFSEMIRDWRRVWGIGAVPFLWVQLASYNPPGDRHWPMLRDSQTATLDLKNTAQVLAIDVGEPNDIHPKDKLTVGRRMALAARAVAYGENIVYSGPQLRQVSREEGKLRLWFDHAGSGLAARSGKLTGFRVAGPDGKFVDAEAVIEGATVVVSGGNEPVAVRYAWENDPKANLVNREGLPAVPFRTDAFPVGAN
ncbi:MAG: sialate O-acetylesterase [Bryobacteraceae bacterium]|nr:sialate O-acetylesterase [Bryobacteraceae bacterium]